MVPLRVRLGLAVSLGAAFGVRIGGVVLVGYAVLLALAELALHWRSGHDAAATAARAGRWAVLLAPVIPLAYLSTTRWGLDAQFPDWPVVAAVERLGMRFAVVKVRPDIAGAER